MTDKFCTGNCGLPYRECLKKRGIDLKENGQLLNELIKKYPSSLLRHIKQNVNGA